MLWISDRRLGGEIKVNQRCDSKSGIAFRSTRGERGVCLPKRLPCGSVDGLCIKSARAFGKRGVRGGGGITGSIRLSDRFQAVDPEKVPELRNAWPRGRRPDNSREMLAGLGGLA